MTNYLNKLPFTLLLLSLLGLAAPRALGAQSSAESQVVGALQAAAAADRAPGGQQEESYQRVYEAFTKLVSSMSNNSLGNARRLVSRLNQLVGGAEQQRQTLANQDRQQQQQSVDEKTEQILQRLDQVSGSTDQHTLRQLQDDVNKLVDSLGDSYLRNIRRLIERVDRAVGRPSGQLHHHQAGDRFQEGSESARLPGFPGWDELITAVDRMQKSLASFVRSSTKLITSGRR